MWRREPLLKTTNNIILKRWKNGELTIEEDQVIVEYPLTIHLNGEELVTLLCTPTSLKELIVGFLLSESFIDDIDEINELYFEEELGRVTVNTGVKRPLREKLIGRRTITSGCGKGTSFYSAVDQTKAIKIQKSMEIHPGIVLQLMKEFNQDSKLFRDTGGVHGCALCDISSILFHEEDIGRHNAMDKLIGRARLEGIELSDKLVLTTGRISSELLIKAAKQGIPVIASRSAPTELAVRLAKETGIELIGFARGDKLNIYSNFPSTKV